jgi:anti-anti-sigma factor
VHGEIGRADEEALRAAVLEALQPGRRLVLDLSETSSMAYCGVRVIVDAFRELGRDRSAVVVRRPSPVVRHLLHVTAVERFITIEDFALRTAD